MQLNITFRQFGASDSLKEYAREKVDRVNRLLDRAGEAHVVLSLERHLHHADITIHSGAWILRGREKSDDMYASIDLAMDKIERQLRRYRDKLKSHHGKEKVHHRQDLVRVRHDVFEVHEEGAAEAAPPATQAAPAVSAQEQVAESGVARLVRTTHLAIQSLSVDDAVMQMNLMNNDFYVFQNQQSQALSIVYRRKEGGFGLIEPHLPDAPVAATGT
ncbi:ribosome hibernation-promoting factor, HPF/YfiA family [Corallococcus carmarthensis]|uniref:Ribosome hibernation promoting factor n=1 Tax=Corallococcus carmarthensis TaxID=2316728 RepID=A0A3A8JZ66_9BACT|nr:ribosome-associated translation inhibitor RaiA [Corallococcus carmarthensis]NOK17987.1 ribosome-associated translation inhibitor RaiA [Corallococcus carmarthensis]RKH00257.1 ribosome-associated translation inhibitor RaiA [Corallococcus carmarthensis]